MSSLHLRFSQDQERAKAGDYCVLMTRRSCLARHRAYSPDFSVPRLRFPAILNHPGPMPRFHIYPPAYGSLTLVNNVLVEISKRLVGAPRDGDQCEYSCSFAGMCFAWWHQGSVLAHMGTLMLDDRNLSGLDF